mmetsp:Transcript_15178/g.31478  ORF Transcript_15178/g.31478 Transcript_15178/m.31478 type:complete len:239 (+) Transcript_15178:611-1327(+)
MIQDRLRSPRRNPSHATHTAHAAHGAAHGTSHTGTAHAAHSSTSHSGTAHARSSHAAHARVGSPHASAGSTHAVHAVHHAAHSSGHAHPLHHHGSLVLKIQHGLHVIHSSHALVSHVASAESIRHHPLEVASHSRERILSSSCCHHLGENSLLMVMRNGFANILIRWLCKSRLFHRLFVRLGSFLALFFFVLSAHRKHVFGCLSFLVFCHDFLVPFSVFLGEAFVLRSFFGIEALPTP